MVCNPHRGLDPTQFKKSSSPTPEWEVAITTPFRMCTIMIFYCYNYEMCSWAPCVTFSKEPLHHGIMFKSPRDCFWLHWFCTHLINTLVGRELYEILILRWHSATVLYFVSLGFCSTIPNLKENPSLMKHEVVKSHWFVVVLFLTSVISSAEAKDNV